MLKKETVRTIMERKLRRLIRNTEFLISLRTYATLPEAHELSETVLSKLKLQLKLNSFMLEDARSDQEKKKLEDERKELQAALAAELENGLGILASIITNLKMRDMEEKAEELEILKDVRESELLELTGGKA